MHDLPVLRERNLKHALANAQRRREPFVFADLAEIPDFDLTRLPQFDSPGARSSWGLSRVHYVALSAELLAHQYAFTPDEMRQRMRDVIRVSREFPDRGLVGWAVHNGYALAAVRRHETLLQIAQYYRAETEQ